MTILDPADTDVCPVCDTHRCPPSPFTRHAIAGAVIGAAAGIATWASVIAAGWWMLSALL